ncbi:apyrase-like protein, putative [Bodo saltans]|uniref:Apyrase-like protein, putative n=1 Tax=Bodo saltans TaxID=75058 RepID=A0A0S4JUI2_BODSA|nr:apyrase-like protein, putative [Bodo saltans]|eukprot:CUG93953.1 apyrase-like protein, putative [Bodo saltans]
MEKAIYYSIRSGLNSAWYMRNAHQRRALMFILVFVLLLALWVVSSDSTAKGATLIYHQMSEPSWMQLVADVPTFHVMAVADNDDFNEAAFKGSPNNANVAAPGGGGGEKKKQRVSAFAEATLHVTVEGGGGRGVLRSSSSKPRFSIEWKSVNILKSGYVHDGRGLELSTLQFWNGARLFSCDDHTGIVYEIVLEEGLAPRLVPRHILSDGDGRSSTGMRCEWCTTKGDFMMIGSTGHPWIHEKTGAVVNHHPLWVKMISPLGVVKHIDWAAPYEKMRAAMGIGDTGYLIHECGLWSTKWNRWYFIPRHVSNTPYRPGDEHQHGSTAIIIADASFKKIVVSPLQSTANPTAGVTDCKFVPNGRDREIIVIKTDESKATWTTPTPTTPTPIKGDKNKKKKSSGEDPNIASSSSSGGFQSYISIINTDGEVLMEDMPMPAGWKFEGVELRPIIHSEG